MTPQRPHSHDGPLGAQSDSSAFAAACGLLSVASAAVVDTFAMQTAAQRSPEKKGPKMLFGVESCIRPDFEAMLDGLLGSWGRRVPNDSFIISGGSRDSGPENICAESNTGSSRLCKEATMLYRAAERAEREGHEWLAGLHEDSFLRLSRLRLLKKLDPNEPVVLAGFGCGQFWKHHRESENGTIPKPDIWVEPDRSCPEVEANAGICSCATFYVSRGALLKMRGNRTLREFVDMHRGASVSRQTDLATSCFLRKLGIPIQYFPTGLEGFSMDIFDEGDSPEYTYEGLKARSSRSERGFPEGIAWIHVNTPKEKVPGVMRHLDQIFNSEE